jgi:hypothetical protein
MSAGAVYVFVRNGTMWVPQAYLKASRTGVDDYLRRGDGGSERRPPVIMIG